ncbi:MAG: PIN domain-containing protein [Dehalococcoidia bacterium]
MAEYLLSDTTVVQYLTRASQDSTAYQAMIGERRLTISFQTQAELLSFPYGEKRRKRLDDLLAAMLKLPHTEATGIWYSRVFQVRTELKRRGQPGGDAGQADIWVISSALEHGLAMLSHDKQQVHLGRAMNLKVLTNLPELRDANPKL